MMRLKTITFGIITLSMLMASCDRTYLPKPEGYYRIDLPEHKYVQLQEEHPYTFEHSVYAKIKPHRSNIAEPHWIDIIYPTMGASVQLTYKKLDRGIKIDSVKEALVQDITKDARRLTSQHNIKAYSIEENIMRNKHGLSAFLFELEGEVPSQLQFYSTDSTKHFLRGALYFPHATKNDSLAPVIKYVKTDIAQLLNTLQWKDR